MNVFTEYGLNGVVLLSVIVIAVGLCVAGLLLGRRRRKSAIWSAFGAVALGVLCIAFTLVQHRSLVRMTNDYFERPPFSQLQAGSPYRAEMEQRRERDNRDLAHALHIRLGASVIPFLGGLALLVVNRKRAL